MPECAPAPSRVHLQRCDERLLRDLHPAELAHALLAFLLLLQKLALAGGVAAEAFGGESLAQRPDGLAGDDLAAGSGCRVHLRPGELPKGRLVVAVSKHYTAVIDGTVHDIGDPCRGGTRCVYGYWRKL